MESVIFAVRFLALSQVILLLFSLAASNNPSCVRLTGILLFVGVAGYLTGPVAMQSDHMELASILFTVASLSPMFIALFVWVGFEEQHTFPIWLWALMSLNVTLEAIAHLSYDGGTEIPTFLSLIHI